MIPPIDKDTLNNLALLIGSEIKLEHRKAKWPLILIYLLDIKHVH